MDLLEIGNAGLVRPIQGVGRNPEWVDCLICQKRVKTIIEKVPSETTKREQKGMALGCIWFLGLGYFIPILLRIAFDYQHQCPATAEHHVIATVGHDAVVENVDLVPSRYSK